MLIKYNINDISPFEKYLDLKTIWNIKESQTEAEKSIERFKLSNNGEVFLICEENKIIGITGYYYTEIKTILGLRWHGIIPEFRLKGYSTKALNELILIIKEKNILCEYIQELIPEKRFDELSKFFIKNDFVQHNRISEIYLEMPKELTFKLLRKL